MIELNSNVLRDPQIKRIVEYSEDNKQINILDQRFYRRNGEFYPSVSTILNYFPKGKFFEDWLKSNGYDSEVITARAAFEGTQVHKAIERYISGEEIKWIDDQGNTLYSLDVWKMILKFSEFWTTHKPELIASEYHLFSDQYKYAGTSDLVVKLNDRIKLLDIKTSNSLHTSQNLQLAAYAKAWNETHDTLIEDIGIIWLKAATRGEDKKGNKIQGAGWQLKEIEDIDYNFKIFLNVYEIYKMENPDPRPFTEILPISIRLD